MTGPRRGPYLLRCLQGSGDLVRARGQCRDDIPSGLFGRGGRQVRPGREIYRPPTASWNIDGNANTLSLLSHLPPLTLIQAQEFTPLSPAPLTSSRSLDLTGFPGESGGRRMEHSPDIDISALGTFGPDMDEILSVGVRDPNRLSARSHMELVRQIFTRVTDNPRTSELAAKLCIGIIEREKKETFLESLLNTCQEW